MTPGPLPNPNRRRRNAPTIPGTELPAAGREGDAPDCPYPLGERGRAWWAHAWATAQATAWDEGTLYVVARRATLEDDLRTLEGADGLLEETIDDVIGFGADPTAMRNLADAVRRMRGLATGRATVHKEMRELDDRLGLSPKGLAALRWKIVGGDEGEKEKPATVTRLRAVDPQAAAKG
jgi:hypothetical protein